MRGLAFEKSEWARPAPVDPETRAAIRQTYARKRSRREARERHQHLSSVVEADVIPRLTLLHPDLAVDRTPPRARQDASLVLEFTNLVLQQDVQQSAEFLREIQAQGIPYNVLFLDLLAPSAALLGRLWEEDLCDFIEVTAGVAQLQLLLSMFGSTGMDFPAIDEQRCILLTGAPGEQHTFGLALVAQLLREAQWQVAGGLAACASEITAAVKSEWFGVVGLSLSCDSRLGELASVIRSIRQSSLNGHIGVLVGGPLFVENPSLVGRVGADASAVDAPTAVLLAQRLLDICLSYSSSAKCRRGGAIAS